MDYSETTRFDVILSNGALKTILSRAERIWLETAPGAGAHRWASYGGRGAISRSDDIRYADIPFVRCEDEYRYGRRLNAVFS